MGQHQSCRASDGIYVRQAPLLFLIYVFSGESDGQVTMQEVSAAQAGALAGRSVFGQGLKMEKMPIN